MHVKICGITDPLDARVAAEAGADFIGMIMAESPRQITADAARAILPVLPAGVHPVLVFRNQSLDLVLEAVATTGVGWIQLHGHEPVPYLRELQQRRRNLRIIRAWEVRSLDSGPELSQYLQAAAQAGGRLDVVLLDAPKGHAHPGFEHIGDVSRRCTTRPPQVWVAGGLTPDNVATAVAVGWYDGVDVAGGVETRPGVKNHAALRRFIHVAKGLGDHPPKPK